MRARLIAVAGGPRTFKHPVDEHARAGAGVAIDHEAPRIRERSCERVGGAASGEAGVVVAVHETLHALAALHPCEALAPQGCVVDSTFGIEEMHPRPVALSPHRPRHGPPAA